MPGWGFLLLSVFIALGLMRRPTANVNAAAVGITIVVLLGVAVSDHLLLG
jgi:hypothetical protein